MSGQCECKSIMTDDWCAHCEALSLQSELTQALLDLNESREDVLALQSQLSQAIKERDAHAVMLLKLSGWAHQHGATEVLKAISSHIASLDTSPKHVEENEKSE